MSIFGFKHHSASIDETCKQSALESYFEGIETFLLDKNC
jgi:hypothetical protein